MKRKERNTGKEMREMLHYFAQWDPPNVPGGTENLLLVSQSDFTLTFTCQPRDLMISIIKCYHLFALEATDIAASLSTRPNVRVLATLHGRVSLSTAEWHSVCVPCSSASANTFRGFEQLFLSGPADCFPYYPCA